MRTAEYLVERRGSPSSSDYESESEEGDACAEEDSSLFITQLINDKFIKGLACVLAEDEKIVGMAGKLIEGAKSEHGTLDLDAWKYFISLPIWQNKKFIRYQTKRGRKQKQLNQQMQEMSDDASLKPLFAEKEHIRVVLILVSLFWSPDVSPTRDGTDTRNKDGYEDYAIHGCCAYNKSFDVDELRMSRPSEHEKMMENMADKLVEDQKIVEIFRELLVTAVHSVSPLGALKHFDKVKEVWGNQRFVDHLLKFDFGPRPHARTISNVRLSVKIRSLIKEDPLFEIISKYDDPGFRMRVALSILIGFWSNQGMIRSLVTMGGGEKKEQSGEGKEESLRDWMSNPPNIMEFYRDKAIWKLAEQLKAEPEAVRLADFYLKTLENDDCFCSYERHFKAASIFWYEPSIILKFNEAMKKDSNLVESLTKYSKDAESLRVQERLFHMRNDFHLDLQGIDTFDSNSKMMRLALKILFVYWVDYDVTHLLWSLGKAKEKIGEKFHLSEDDEVVAFYYYASCATDVEGLKSCIAYKYGKGSDKALSLTNKIGEYQKDKCKEAKESGYSDGPIRVQLVLTEACIVTFSLSWVAVAPSDYANRSEEPLFVLLPL